MALVNLYNTYFHVEDTECPDGESNQRFFTNKSHFIPPKLNRLISCRPVLTAALLSIKMCQLYCQICIDFLPVCVYHSILHQVRQHDDDTTLSVMNDLQHVPGSRRHWTLGNDVGLLLLVGLNPINQRVKEMQKRKSG